MFRPTRFDRIHKRDRRTDGRTDTARRHTPRLCIASRGKISVSRSNSLEGRWEWYTADRCSTAAKVVDRPWYERRQRTAAHLLKSRQSCTVINANTQYDQYHRHYHYHYQFVDVPSLCTRLKCFFVTEWMKKSLDSFLRQLCWLRFYMQPRLGSYQISETGIPRICAWDKKTRKTQEEMDWHGEGWLQTIHQATDMTQHRSALRSLVKLRMPHPRRHGNKSSK